MRSTCWRANGRAAIGDLRYYAESKLDRVRDAARQGADRRGDGALRRPASGPSARSARRIADLDRIAAASDRGWRSDYGTNAPRQRGGADARRGDQVRPASTSARSRRGSRRPSQTRRYTSTQENAWMLLAAAALIKDSQTARFPIDGATISGAAVPPLHRRRGSPMAPVTVDQPRRRRRWTRWSPRPASRSTPEPAGGNGFAHRTRGVLHADGNPVRPRDRRAERPLRRGADGDGGDQATAATCWSSTRSRPASRSRTRTSRRAATSPSIDWLTDGHRQAHRGADRPLRRGARPRRTATRSSTASPTRCGRSRRACSPQPAATVEDMYRPERTPHGAGTVEVVGRRGRQAS